MKALPLTAMWAAVVVLGLWSRHMTHELLMAALGGAFLLTLFLLLDPGG